ncbi:alkaline phosphatase D family protein [Parendozoicomonas sp. Alg238-R29]|uniref:alkaline phosphatase D family protein n=1 Tax=Parendozoicomonas sp. Alg238-R29 TaxID=2993446 RepID=UPI00248DCF0A|nr:alkaline phosphatase D family protein [Parendozoicomonas sp. Alg238-R29]
MKCRVFLSGCSCVLAVIGLLVTMGVSANNSFPQGVRSGDPSSEGVVLWTRLDPKLHPGTHSVTLEVARDPEFGRIIIQESQTVSSLTDHTLHINLEGRLSPDTVYYYRFRHESDVSITGRTKTLPAKDQERSFRMAVLTCQDFSTGYFNAHQIMAGMAKRGELDLTFFDGDFTYEYASYDSDSAEILRPLTLPSRSRSAMNAADFGFLYQNYLSDPQLQESLASMPFILVPDDHEVADNHYWDRVHNKAGIPGKRYRHLTAAEKNQLMLDSRTAWINYNPSKAKVNRNTEDPRDLVKFFRSFQLGKMADFFVTDSRSFRDGEQIPEDAPDKTMLGIEQRDWLLDQIKSSDAHWRLWGNQTMFSRFVAYGSHLDIIPDELINTDQWNGYIYERGMIKDSIESLGIKNLVVLTGDMHTSLVSYIKPFEEPDSPVNLGIELMTPSITSPNMKDEAGMFGGFSLLMDIIRMYLKDQNHHLVHFNSEKHGFAVLTINKDNLVWDVYTVPVKERLKEPEATHMLQVLYKDGVLKVVHDDG